MKHEGHGEREPLRPLFDSEPVGKSFLGGEFARVSDTFTIKKETMAKSATKIVTPDPIPSVEVIAPAAAPKPKAEKAPPPPRVAMACRMSPELAKAIVGKFRVTIPIPKDDTVRDIAVGARLLLREWVGAPTGRADLVRVVAVSEDDGAEGYADRCTIERGWCWLQGKMDDDISQLALTVLPDHFPAIGY